jgi:polysaccharide export outer membrane protein
VLESVVVMDMKTVVAAVALAGLLAGCKTGALLQHGGGLHASASEQVYLFAPAGAYRLDSGDRLRIVVFGQETLTRSYAVDATGQISVPLIGAVRARGLTTVQLAQRITSLLNQKVLKDAEVSVEIETYRPFFILGEVRQPGQFAFVADITVENAIAIAGGYTERANERRIRVTRRYGDEQATMLMSPQDAVLPGDTIYVIERWF